MSEVKRYADAMIRGDIAVCEAIERQYNVYGFPPEFVSMTLSMVDALKERDALAAENEQLRGLIPSPPPRPPEGCDLPR